LTHPVRNCFPVSVRDGFGRSSPRSAKLKAAYQAAFSFDLAKLASESPMRV
jgi:hypothetical protein